MKLARAGQAACIVGGALLVMSLLFHDLFVGAVFLVLLVAIGSEAVWVRLATRKPETKFRLMRKPPDGPQRKAVLFSGQELVESLSISKRIGGRIQLESEVRFLRIEPVEVRGTGTFPATARFRTDYSGEYSCERVGLTVTGPLGLFSSKSSFSFRQKFLVYPRVVQAAGATVKLLGRETFGETPTEMPGVGGEFYELRDYRPDDSFRSINWKATARKGKLMATERMREVGGSFFVVLDARAPSYDATDRLVTTFLLLANSLAGAGVPFGIFVHDGERVRSSTDSSSARRSLETALREALAFAKLSKSPEVLELVPLASGGLPHGSMEEDQSVLGLSTMRRDEMRSALRKGDPWVDASRRIAEESPTRVVYVSGLFGRVEPVMELGWQANRQMDSTFAVANPCEAAATEAIGESRHGNEAYRRVSRGFRSAGLGYFAAEPLVIASQFLSG